MAQNKKNSNRNTGANTVRLEKIIQEQSAQLETQSAQIAKLQNEVEKLTQHLLNAQQARFGQSSEKTTYVLPGQDNFFDEAENEQDPKLPEPTLETVVKERAHNKKRSREDWLAGLPEEEVVIDLPESELDCGCGGTLVAIGRKFLREDIEFIPASVVRKKYFLITYACKKCEEDTGHGHIVTVRPPAHIWQQAGRGGHLRTKPGAVFTGVFEPR